MYVSSINWMNIVSFLNKWCWMNNVIRVIVDSIKSVILKTLESRRLQTIWICQIGFVIWMQLDSWNIRNNIFSVSTCISACVHLYPSESRKNFQFVIGRAMDRLCIILFLFIFDVSFPLKINTSISGKICCIVVNE